MNLGKTKKRVFDFVGKGHLKLIPLLALLTLGNANAQGLFALDIVATLNSLQLILAQIGPVLSAVLFIVAGVFYAVGQMLPPDKKANFHTTSVNIIIGAIMVAVLSVASSGFAVASTHLLANMSANVV
ncbi:MAG: hypothetical protein KGH54_00350 [Candidatus Micrarchaeota archaeon]|nr:hypothetical protein [Candidatus Micrarchaeota archaeon]